MGHWVCSITMLSVSKPMMAYAPFLPINDNVGDTFFPSRLLCTSPPVCWSLKLTTWSPCIRQVWPLFGFWKLSSKQYSCLAFIIFVWLGQLKAVSLTDLLSEARAQRGDVVDRTGVFQIESLRFRGLLPRPPTLAVVNWSGTPRCLLGGFVECNDRYEWCPPGVYKHCERGQIPPSVVCGSLNVKLSTFVHSGYLG